MSTASTAMKHAGTASLPSPATGMRGTAAGRQGSVNSSEILRGRTVIEINHNGATYRLQATRLGKLILTK